MTKTQDKIENILFGKGMPEHAIKEASNELETLIEEKMEEIKQHLICMSKGAYTPIGRLLPSDDDSYWNGYEEAARDLLSVIEDQDKEVSK